MIRRRDQELKTQTQINNAISKLQNVPPIVFDLFQDFGVNTAITVLQWCLGKSESQIQARKTQYETELQQKLDLDLSGDSQMGIDQIIFGLKVAEWVLS